MINELVHRNEFATINEYICEHQYQKVQRLNMMKSFSWTYLPQFIDTLDRKSSFYVSIVFAIYKFLTYNMSQCAVFVLYSLK